MLLQDLSHEKLLDALIGTAAIGPSPGVEILKGEVLRRLGVDLDERASRQQDSPELVAKRRALRRAFAIEASKSTDTNDHGAWKEVARRARAEGLYSKTTFLGDIATALRSYAKKSASVGWGHHGN